MFFLTAPKQQLLFIKIGALEVIYFENLRYQLLTFRSLKAVIASIFRASTRNSHSILQSIG